jgi:uncharacterized membrane protein YvlD (DUF360 family)
VLLWLTDKVLATFRINGTGSLLLSAGVITAVNALLHFAVRLNAAAHAASPGPIRWI